jgi:hypothetical protein
VLDNISLGQEADGALFVRVGGQRRPIHGAVLVIPAPGDRFCQHSDGSVSILDATGTPPEGTTASPCKITR